MFGVERRIESQRVAAFGPLALAVPAPVPADRTILAIDTATEFCSVALWRGADVVAAEEQVGQRHSERLLPMVDEVLSGAGVALRDCAAIAFGAGPGSFTGLRIACAVAQGLGFGVGRPLIAVGNLEALAWRAKQAAPEAVRVAVAIDARMQEAYWAIYDFDGTSPRAVAAPALTSAVELAPVLAAFGADTLVGDALAKFPQALAALDVARRLPGLRADATAIVHCAVPALANGRSVPAARAAPLYVRDRVAMTIEQRQALRRAGAPLV